MYSDQRDPGVKPLTVFKIPHLSKMGKMWGVHKLANITRFLYVDDHGPLVLVLSRSHTSLPRM